MQLQAQTDSYRRIRNTFRYIIGNLDGFDSSEKIDESEFPDLENIFFTDYGKLMELLLTA